MRRLFCRLPLSLLLLAGAALAGCERRSDDQPVVVSAIGGEPRRADPSRRPLQPAQRLLMASVAQGLVRFDANGQVEPALAERWIVIDDGRSYIFRLRDAYWPDGEPVTAREVVAILRRAIAPGSRNPLAPFLSGIDEIVAMTPQVIEIRLSRPLPDLLKLFAQPELAVVTRRGLDGTGPFRVVRDDRGPGVLLRPLPDPDLLPEDLEEPEPEEMVRLIGERAALAIVRFREQASDLVTGGTFADWPLVAAADVPPATVRIDPAVGLFGFAVVSRGGFLADAENRAALAMALDRAAITGALRPDWAPVEAILPQQFESAAPPHRPDWQPFSLDQRRSAARMRVVSWRAGHDGAPIRIRIALPSGPGGTLLWGFVASSLASIGVEPVRVAPGDAADLRLVDEVAPYDSARWMLARACDPCADPAREAIEAARTAPDLAIRGLRLAEADAALTADAAFIPIAQPLRWSLVAGRLRAFQPNARAWHPLNHLREGPT